VTISKQDRSPLLLWDDHSCEGGVTAAASPRGCAGKTSSEVEQPGRARQTGALHAAPHGAPVAMPRVAHDVLVAHALVVGLGDEAAPQGGGAQPVKTSISRSAVRTRAARMRRTASGCSAAGPHRRC
jgi:hypothetical protein